MSKFDKEYESIINEEALNNREEMMIKYYNACLNKNVPITEEGYNSIGGSKGIARAIADNDEAFTKFFNTENKRVQAIKNIFVVITRSKG